MPSYIIYVYVALLLCLIFRVNAQCEVQSIEVNMKVRDFRHKSNRHPDFQRRRYPSSTKRMLKPHLDQNGRPERLTTNIPWILASQDSIKQWFTDIPGMNIPINVKLKLKRIAPGSRKFKSEFPGTTKLGKNFFPINNRGFKDHTSFKNYGFTTETHVPFIYRGVQERFLYRGDDDFWMFIDGVLLVDLGGLHGPQMYELTLTRCDPLRPSTYQKNNLKDTTTLCLLPDKEYTMSIFHAERHTTGSTYYFESSFDFIPEIISEASTDITVTEELGYIDFSLLFTQRPDQAFRIVCTAEEDIISFNSPVVPKCTTETTQNIRATFKSVNPSGTRVTCASALPPSGTDLGIFKGISSSVFVIRTTTSRGPTISNLIPTKSAVCTEPSPLDPAQANIVDYCGGSVSIDRSMIEISRSCPNVFSRRYSYEMVDLCGNVGVQTHTINVVDNSSPELSDEPKDTTVPCHAIPSAVTLTARDQCAGDVPVSFTETRTDGTCSQRYTLLRSWSASDNCFQKTIYSQSVNVVDNDAPTFHASSPVSRIEADCSALPGNPTTISAVDVCDGPISAPLVSVKKINVVCKAQYEIERTWKATDSCGNENTHVSIIEVKESTGPKFSDPPPQNIVSKCSATTPPTLLASGVCGQTATVAFNEETTPGTGSNGVSTCKSRKTVSRSWTATSECGKTTMITQTDLVTDHNEPSFDGTFPDYSQPSSCDNVPLIATLTATDECDGSVAVTSRESRVDGSCPHTYDLVRTWTAQDECGNRNDETRTLKVLDDQKPILANVPDEFIYLQCASDVPNLWAQILASTSTDNCAGTRPVTGYDQTTSMTCVNKQTKKRTFNSADLCGNRASYVSTIIIEDTIPPTFTAFPDNVTIGCHEAIPALNEGIEFDDNCGKAKTTLTVVQEQRVDGNCANNYVLLRTYKIDDACGLSATRVHAITVEDIVNPELIDVPAGLDNIACDSVPVTPTLHATDNCGGIVTVTSNSIDIIDTVDNPNGCSSRKVINRTFTATDICGNVDMATQLIRIIDNTNPVISNIPDDVVISPTEFENIVDPVLKASDACQPGTELPVTLVSVRESQVCDESFTELRTFSAEDACGNKVNHLQRLTVTFETAPTLDGLPSSDVLASCDDIPTAATVTAVSGVGVSLTINQDTTVLNNGCPNRRMIKHSYSAQDDCGNTSGGSYSVNVTDFSPPDIIGAPTDLVVSCDAVPPVDTGVTAVDSCPGDVTLSFKEISIPGECTNQYSLTRTWTATDVCSISSTYRQVIAVFDNTKPTLFGIPANIDVSCDSLPAVASVNALDNCSGSRSVSYSNNRVDGACAYNYTLLRSWSATDKCGNIGIGNQTISVSDTTKPSLLNIPANITVACSAVPDIATVNVQDNCDTTLTSAIANDVRVDGICSNEYVLHRTYTATDVCGNTIEGKQVITVVDESLPKFDNPPADIEVECDAIPDMPINITASDTCGGDVNVTSNEVRVEGSCSFSYTLLRTFTAIDVCNNVNTYTQTILVRDSVPPVISGNIEDRTLHCNDVFDDPVITASDKCSDVGDIKISKSVVDTPGQCLNNHVVVYRHQATDQCGNTVTELQTITYSDVTPPVYTTSHDFFDGAYPPSTLDITYSESEIDQIEYTNYLIASDLCESSSRCQTLGTKICESSIYAKVVEERTNGTCLYEYTLYRQWNFTDECSNSEVITQTVNVVDNEKPTLHDVPVDVGILCSSDIPSALDYKPTAKDNSKSVRVTHIDEELPLVSGNGILPHKKIIRRTFTATDDCGNTADAVQIIRINDNISPVIAGIPSSMNVSCATPFNPDNVTISVTDNCDSDLTADLDTNVQDGDCAHNKTTHHTWTARDSSGNEVIGVLDIFSSDISSPQFLNLPQSFVEYGCTDDFDDPPTVTAFDSCSETTIVEFTITPIVDHCLKAQKRKWTTVDECGNKNEFEQVVQQSDYDAPELLDVPDNIDVTLSSAVPEVPEITSHDNCSVSNVTVSDEIKPGCSESSFTILRTFSATDTCGNLGSTSQIINVGDTTPPQFVLPKLKSVYSCDQDLGSITPTLEGDDADLIVNKIEHKYPGSCAQNYSLESVFSAIDQCGNAGGVVINVQIADISAPVFSEAPPSHDISVPCNAPAASSSDVAVKDDCAAVKDIEVRVINDYSNDNPCITKGFLLRSFEATDPCGNILRSDPQRINLIDEHPTFVGTELPADMTLGCDDKIPNADTLTAKDDCGQSLVNMDETRDGNPCEGDLVITRVWKATDSCDQTTVHEQRIKLVDDGKPIISIESSIGEIICGEVTRNNAKLPPSEATAAYSCAILDQTKMSVAVEETVEVITGDLSRCEDGPVMLKRTLKATTKCGASSEIVQNVTVVPTTRERAIFKLTFGGGEVSLESILQVLKGAYPEYEFENIGVESSSNSSTVSILSTYPDGTFALSKAIVSMIQQDSELQQQLETATGASLIGSAALRVNNDSSDKPTENTEGKKSTPIAAIVAPIVVVGIAACVGVYIYKKKTSVPSLLSHLPPDANTSQMPFFSSDES